MQIIADFTPEELSQEDDVLFLCCHAIARLKMVGSVIQEGCVNINHPVMDGYRASEVGTMGAIVSDAAQEIEALIEIEQKKWQSGRYSRTKGDNHAD